MRARFLAFLVCIVAAASAGAAVEQAGVTVQMETPVVLEGQEVRGWVQSSRPLDSLSVTCADGFGHILRATRLDVQGGQARPFSLLSGVMATPLAFIEAVGSAGVGRAQFVTLPASDSFWSGFAVLADKPPKPSPGVAVLARALGINGALVRGTQECALAGQAGLRPFPTGLVAPDAEAMSEEDFVRALALYLSDGAASALSRPFSLSDLSEVSRIASDARRQTLALRNFAPPGIVVFDNASVTRGSRVLDVSFGEADLAGFAIFASQRVGSAAQLSARWGRRIRSAAEVTPMTAREMKKWLVENGAEPFDIAPWALHREYMDGRFAATIAQVAQEVQAGSRVPEEGDVNWNLFEIRTGFSGAHAPSAYGGWDWTALPGVSDYTILDASTPQWALSLVRDLAFARVFARIDGARAEAGDRLYRAVFEGLAGVVVDNCDKVLDQAAGTAPAEGERVGNPLAASLAAIQGLSDVASLAERNAGVAVVYSPQSVRTGWMLDYLAREEADESGPAAGTEALAAWSEILSDLGADYGWVSEGQVALGGLMDSSYRAVVLPETWALATETVQALAEFAAAGGLVIADNGAGLVDRTCRAYRRSPADDLFAIRRAPLDNASARSAPSRRARSADGLIVADVSLESQHRQAVGQRQEPVTRVVNTLGAGAAYYLNLVMSDYPAQDDASKAVVLNMVGEALERALIAPQARVLRDGKPLKARMRTYDLPHTRFVFIDVSADAGPIPAGTPLEIRLPTPAFVYDLRPSAPEGEPLGLDSVVRATMPAHGPIALALTEMTITGLGVEVDFDGAALYVRATLSSQEPPGTRLFKIDLYDPMGARVPSLSRTAIAANGTCLAAVPMPLNAVRGVWRVLVRDLATGMASWFDVEVQ